MQIILYSKESIRCFRVILMFQPLVAFWILHLLLVLSLQIISWWCWMFRLQVVFFLKELFLPSQDFLGLKSFNSFDYVWVGGIPLFISPLPWSMEMPRGLILRTLCTSKDTWKGDGRFPDFHLSPPRDDYEYSQMEVCILCRFDSEIQGFKMMFYMEVTPVRKTLITFKMMEKKTFLQTSYLCSNIHTWKVR